nr:transcription factor spt8 [Quercus suber]
MRQVPPSISAQQASVVLAGSALRLQRRWDVVLLPRDQGCREQMNDGRRQAIRCMSPRYEERARSAVEPDAGLHQQQSRDERRQSRQRHCRAHVARRMRRDACYITEFTVPISHEARAVRCRPSGVRALCHAMWRRIAITKLPASICGEHWSPACRDDIDHVATDLITHMLVSCVVAMASFDDDADGANNSQDEFENEDEDMEDANDAEQDQEADQDDDQGGDDDDDEDNDNEDNDNDDDDDDDQNDNDNEPESPSQRLGQHTDGREPPRNPAVVLTSPSPRTTSHRSPGRVGLASFIPPVRPEALSALTYDIVPTMAAPQSTSINAVAATPDMKWVFSGGTDGYVRMYNWVETANGKVPLTVAQKHPFVDSVMKAGSLVTYWENEEPQLRTPPQNTDEGKWTSPVYSLAVQHQAVWLLSGLDSGGINMQTCRHQAGTRITTLKEHTSAVSVLVLSQDESSLLSGSWDKNIHDWDLQTAQVKRTFKGAGGQISAIETRPISDLPVPEVSESFPGSINDTFYSNNADKALTNGFIPDDLTQGLGAGDEDALGSPSGSLFGENDHGSLFGEDNVGGGGNAFGDDDDELSRALQSGLEESDRDALGEQDTDMGGVGVGGPVQPPDASAAVDEIFGPAEDTSQPQPAENHVETVNGDAVAIFSNGLPHSDEPLTAPPTNEDDPPPTDLPPQSESTFLDSAMDGTLRIWDRRVSAAIATIQPNGSTPPWCTGACWSPDGNFFYAGRRNNTVDEYSIHHLGSKRSEPNRVFKFQPGSGPVYAVRAMPNRKHLVWYVPFPQFVPLISYQNPANNPPPVPHKISFESMIPLSPSNTHATVLHPSKSCQATVAASSAPSTSILLVAS